ncbi:KEOPS complex kinase/ATPase Bud32 [Candidatus Nitrosotenuis uzonensis]|uniref:non-specific serine/threonine protein kinase n=1 Tax=Candidatus Nitrosotenuis uzonensis TaxID=1407055 RepID=V6ARA0_9ARCH|nr:KEOPS complex kinase/ATPase Bud32 [Candidatus Nitrosotenuis uzonensis]CDI05147.1 putative Lipopolysaccharide kinase (Kdo/WaaP) family protein [Candidatus Nitrosotenuis uzonensis]
MKLLKKGAEGDIYLTKYDGMIAVLKTRKRKPYRNQTLDDKIRRYRTIHEAMILAEAKLFGVPTPLVYRVDTNECTILMQHIPGIAVKNLKQKELTAACSQIGRITGILHRNGVMHGDLTTSNFISYKKRIFAIDFGLAQKTPRLEDHAVDIRLFKEILGSEHVECMGKLLSAFLKGYRSSVGTQRFSKVIHHVSVIEGRGRYAQVI